MTANVPRRRDGGSSVLLTQRDEFVGGRQRTREIVLAAVLPPAVRLVESEQLENVVRTE